MARTFALFLAAVSLAGCTTAVPGVTGLAGTRWAVTAIDGQAPAMPDRATLTFEETRIGANVGCNGMGGDYRLEGGRVIAGPLMATRMFCEGPVWQQEQAVSALLAGAPEVKHQGDRLRLESGGHSLEAARVR